MLNPVDEPKKGVSLFPPSEPHFHCPKCWGEEWTQMGFAKVCKHCPLDAAAMMILCTPMACASS